MANGDATLRLRLDDFDDESSCSIALPSESGPPNSARNQRLESLLAEVVYDHLFCAEKSHTYIPRAAKHSWSTANDNYKENDAEIAPPWHDSDLKPSPLNLQSSKNSHVEEEALVSPRARNSPPWIGSLETFNLTGGGASLEGRYRNLGSPQKFRTTSKSLNEDRHTLSTSSSMNNSLLSSVEEVQKRLTNQRRNANRAESLENMSNAEILEEKTAVQRELLNLEERFGRPETNSARKIVRPLYDRYRQLKRMVASFNAMSDDKLQTIGEHDVMHTFGKVKVSQSPQINENASDPANLETVPTAHDREKLEEERRTKLEEKKRLRRVLRAFETESEVILGRKITNKDRMKMAAVYTDYKQVKARLRLVEALLNKETTSVFS